LKSVGHANQELELGLRVVVRMEQIVQLLLLLLLLLLGLLGLEL
jgi:hypothetical protein